MKCQPALIVLWFATAISTGASSPNYRETGECEETNVCSYSYSAQQEYVNSGEQQRTKVNATVDITCTSVGIYNESDAKLYCMVLKQPKIFTNTMENLTASEMRTIQQSVSEQLGNWFCFVQSRSGKIPAVYHPNSEPDHVISLKKSIAAAFQANFEGTDEEEEIDPQSRHKSHYSYIPTGEEGLLKMKRKVRKPDVSEYSTEDPSDDVDTEQDEEVEYRSGRLERSSGNASVHLINSSDSDPDEDSISLSRAFAAIGSYKMELRKCRKMGRYDYGVQKRRILAEIENSEEEDLKGSIDKKREAIAEMKMLREKLPSGSVVAALQNFNDFGDTLVPILQNLMQLEAEYGAPTSSASAIDEIMTFISNMPNSEDDRKVREAVLVLLSTEGSLKAQMALLSAYDNAMDDEEANTILTQISFMETVRIGFVIGVEERLVRQSESTFLNQQLLLVFSSLATKDSDEVEDRVMNYLSTRAISLRSQAQPDTSEIDIMLRALGNTGSKLSISLIFSFLDADSNAYDQIKLEVIDALAKVTDDATVLARLEDLLQEDFTEECAEAVVETLHNGLEYVKATEQDLAQYSSLVRSHSLLYTLAEAVSDSNSTELHSMLVAYLNSLGADDGIFDLLYNEESNRRKRGTNWRSSNSDYDYVASLSTRRGHVSRYNRHKAYINSRRIGISEANIKIAYGMFAGTNTHCDQLKTYGRYVVVGKLLSKTRTLADAKIDIQATTTSASVVAYVRIGSNTLLNYRNQRSLSSPCRLFTRPLSQGRTRLFRLSYNVFVYVGYLTLRVELHAHYNLEVNANICIGRTGTEVSGGLAALTPTIGVTLSGGVRGNLLELARGGVTVSATFNYRLEPAVSVQGCTAYCQLSGRMCVGIYHSFPNNNIRLETWYQIRNVGLCGSGWFQYPCVKWGRRETWDDLSFRWDLGSSRRRALWQSCTGNLHPTCAAGALSSPLFSY